LRRAGPLEITRIEADSAAQAWTALVEFAVPAEDPVTFKANLRPSRTMEFLEAAAAHDIVVQAHAGNGIVIGHLPDDVTSAGAAKSLLDPLRVLAHAQGGNLVVQSCDAAWTSELPVFGEPEASACLMSKLKSQLDPRNVLNPHLAGWPPATT
jgi:glycolate oxidase FAD binding subunit